MHRRCCPRMRGDRCVTRCLVHPKEEGATDLRERRSESPKSPAHQSFARIAAKVRYRSEMLGIWVGIAWHDLPTRFRKSASRVTFARHSTRARAGISEPVSIQWPLTRPGGCLPPRLAALPRGYFQEDERAEPSPATGIVTRRAETRPADRHAAAVRVGSERQVAPHPGRTRAGGRGSGRRPVQPAGA